MKKPTAQTASGQPGAKRPGFTLVELIVAMAVGLLVLAAVASVLVMSLRMVNKNQQIDGAIAATRLVQEHINGEMAVAISMTTPLIRPTYSSPSTTTPTRYAVMTYRVPIGSYGTLQSDTPNTSNTLTVVCPADVTPKAGDYCLMDSPNLDSGIRITDVSGTGTLTLTLASTVAAGTNSSDTTGSTVKAGSLVRIQRERQYATVPPSPSNSPVTELHWYESTINSTYTVLSTNVDSNARYLFAQIPVDPSYPTVVAKEPSVSWQFSYVATGSNAYSQGGNASYYQANYAEGLIMPKSGDPLSASSIAGGGSLGTSTTLVSSTTTMGTSTTLVSSTTTLGTSTSKVSSTTTKGTSTTKVSSTTTLASSTTLQSTSTTKQSTTTLGTSSTKYSSTTLVSTTTTKGTTTTTLGTSTTKISSTTTMGTSTTKVSSTTLLTTTTTLGTTTLGTSTTKQSTTTLGTSTTKVSSTTTLGTTTLGTSTTKLSTTTTTIPFDG